MRYLNILLASASPEFLISSKHFISSLPAVDYVTSVVATSSIFEKLAVKDFDLIVLDARLPDMTGIDVARLVKLQAMPPKIALVASNDYEFYLDTNTSTNIDGFIDRTEFVTQFQSLLESLFLLEKMEGDDN